MNLLLLLFSLHAESAVTKTKFIEEFVSGLPTSFCESSTYFRKCFQLEEKDCKKKSALYVKSCVTEMEKELPTSFAAVADGKKWGEKLGECAGTKFEMEQKEKKISSQDCSDPKKWK
jgi:hypothetical protein